VNDYFIICTLCIALIAFSVFNNWAAVTNGPMGISGIPAIHLFGLVFSDRLAFLLLSALLMTLIWLLIRQLFSSGFGRVLTAIGNDELFTASLGKNVNGAKITAFTISAMLAGVPGVLYAHYVSFIDPSSFDINESIYILSIVIIGGFGKLGGNFLAAIFMVALPEILRFIGIPYALAANLRQILYGILLLIVVLNNQLKPYETVNKK
jgi:branched-chain amino acid transport system permease protein